MASHGRSRGGRSRSRAFKNNAKQARSCIVLTPRKFKNIWLKELLETSTGWRSIKAVVGGFNELPVAVQMTGKGDTLVLAAHRGAKGGDIILEGNVRRRLSDVLAAVLPDLNAREIHFHVCDTGHAFQPVCAELNSNADLKDTLGAGARSWGLSGIIQALDNKYKSDGKYKHNTHDKWLASGLLESKAPRGSVRKCTLAWTGLEFKIKSSRVLGGKPVYTTDKRS
jgi:hypothetical protein